MLLAAEASCSRMQPFGLSGRIDGLQVGDTLRFEHVLLPEWNNEPAFDVVIGEAGAFAYRGGQAHDGYYLMICHPKVGEAVESDRRGKSVIVTDGDRITLAGTTDEIYYCTLGGGICDEPALAGMLAHGWTKVEVETDRPENGRMLERYAVEGWPTFVLIAPDGTIAARRYAEAFFSAKELSEGAPGGAASE